MIALAAMLAMAVAPTPAPRFCRTVHGLMMATNGNPALRIYEIGTRHALGVDVDQDLSLKQLPANIRSKWLAVAPNGSLFEVSIYGDFRVCARRPRRAGEMEIVDVVEGRNLFVGSYR